MSYSDTPEQAAVIGWSGHRLVVRAFACMGKTSTLVRYALAHPNSRMLYLADNRAVRDEAEQKFCAVFGKRVADLHPLPQHRSD